MIVAQIVMEQALKEWAVFVFICFIAVALNVQQVNPRSSKLSDAYLKASYYFIETPFIIQGRESNCGATDTWTIARINEDDARVLCENGLSFIGDFDWEKHYKRIELMKAEKQKKEDEEKIQQLTS